LQGRIDWSVSVLHFNRRQSFVLTCATPPFPSHEIVEDMSAPSAFSQALKDVSVVAHVASPVNYSLKDKENDVLKPAINGILRLLEDSAKEKSVERVVFTSSAATIIGAHCVPGVSKTYR
jgi:nucleoside-diphosphate-sugar epimerase